MFSFSPRRFSVIFRVRMRQNECILRSIFFSSLAFYFILFSCELDSFRVAKLELHREEHGKRYDESTSNCFWFWRIWSVSEVNERSVWRACDAHVLLLPHAGPLRLTFKCEAIDKFSAAASMPYIELCVIISHSFVFFLLSPFRLFSRSIFFSPCSGGHRFCRLTLKSVTEKSHEHQMRDTLVWRRTQTAIYDADNLWAHFRPLFFSQPNIHVCRHAFLMHLSQFRDAWKARKENNVKT